MNTRTMLVLAVAGLGFALDASADHHEKTESPVLTAFLNVYDRAAEHTVSLAEAMSEEQYDWRPSEGVRSVKEAIGHVAGANYFFGSKLGATMPDGINPRQLDDSIKSKEDAIAVLKKSVKFVREAIKNVPESDYGTEIDLFGNKAPKFQMIQIVADHAAEHLGQLIAYARSNGVTPPWSVKGEG